MKKLFLIALLTFFCVPAEAVAPNSPGALSSGRVKVSRLDDGKTVLNFRAIGLDGKPFDALTLKGKAVLLDFWAVWCAPCIKAFPTLNKLHNALRKQNFEVVGIAAYSGGAGDVSKFLKKYDVDYKVLIGDEKLVEKFEVIGYPTYFLINPQGQIHKTYVGEVKKLFEQVKKDLQELQKKRTRE